MEQPQLDIATRNIILGVDQIKLVSGFTSPAREIIICNRDIHPRGRGVIPLLKFYDMRRVAFVPSFDVKINVVRRDVIVLPELEIISKAAAGSRVDIRARDLCQYQFGGAALKINVLERTG